MAGTPTCAVTTSPGTVPPTARRRTFVVQGAAAAAGVLALASCLDRDEPAESTPVDGTDRIGEAPVTLRQLPGFLEDIAADAAIATPDGPIRLTARARRDHLSSAQAESLLGLRLPPEQQVEAPPGQEFLLFALEREGGRWPVPAVPHPGPAYEIVVGIGDEERRLPLDIDRALDGSVLLRVPAGAEPAAMLLEVTLDGRRQGISLMDGSGVIDEVPGARGRSILAGEGNGAGPALVERHEGESMHDAEGNRHVVSLGPVSGATTPWMPGVGWASEGHQFLWVLCDALDAVERGTDLETVDLPEDVSASRLELSDGSHATPRPMGAGLQALALDLSPTTDLLFEIPHVLEAAHLRLRLDPTPRPGADLDELQTAAELTIDIEFTAGTEE